MSEVITTMVTPIERMVETASGVISWLRQKIVTLNKVMLLEDPRYLKLFSLGNFKLVQPGNIWQPGIPLVDSIEKGREGNQEGSDQHKGEEGVISVNHLFGTNAIVQSES